MNALTETQHTILALIADRIAVEGMPPSQTEIARAMGFSGVRAAQYHLEALEQAGAIERLPGKARGLRVTSSGVAMLGGDDDGGDGVDAAVDSAAIRAREEDALLLPVLGRVAAGAPIGADPNVDEHVLLDRNIFFPSPDYMLKVQGDSMRDEGIFDGDLIGVHRTPEARSGEIVVARIDDEITVKLLKIGKDRIRLLPRNPDYQPIEVMPDQDFAIEGLYCGLVRRGR
ncbi:transcriptional repressor LexA [Lysobacter ciconiae]|uniref:LexA repressor n=1 Tax=Novilysobacter ciconiae TaxID=2781022 RepID=A0A7S6ZRM2_9GAMM|nr:transcriptional repressor LexA [Lysobacter ciconiae]QOW18814.1 transcriptional repressor LexA [Lysobacter ciconiae]